MTDPPASTPRRTPLTAVHEDLGATLTDFAGWLMPLRYGSETAEHKAVRSAAGLFDLSHMGELAVTGPGAAEALDYALVGEMSAVRPGRARYTMICAEDGGVVDDLIVYRLADHEYLVVANAANTATVFRALTERSAGRDATVADRTADYALIAIQGPRSAGILGPLTNAHPAGAASTAVADAGRSSRAATADRADTPAGDNLSTLKYYASYPATVADCQVLLARTGYTGEDGFEIFATPADAGRIWAALLAAGTPGGLTPAGLAARDTLRLEAGMPLYGNELSRAVTPYDAGLGRVVKLDKPGDFVGRAALAQRAQAAPERVLVGLTGQSRRVPRHGYEVLWAGEPRGTVTSGAPSPTLGVPIAMAYVRPEVQREAEFDGDGRLAIDIRGSAEPATLTALPFYRRRA